MPDRRRTRRGVLLLLAALVVAALAYVGWTAYRVDRELSAAVAGASGLEAAARAGDQATLDQSVDELAEHAAEAADLTGGPAWRPLTWLPVVGDDARGVRAASEVVDDLARDGLRPLLGSADQLDALVPAGGRIDVQALAALREPVSRGSAALDAAARRLGREDSSGYVDRLGTQFRDLRRRIDVARRGLDAADTALGVMPSMLGADGPRSYLMVFQNNAEVRATGGLPGSVSLLRADDGALSIGRQAAGGSLAPTAKPVVPITAAEERIYGEVVGRFFVDANMTPDFPRAAELMKAQWNVAFPDDQVDGVVMVDPVALSYVLAVIGPVDVDGISLSGDTVVDELLHGTYLRLPDPRDQDAFFARAATAVFDRLVAGGSAPRDLLGALTKGVREHRLLVHSFDGDDQQVLDPTAVAGRVVTDPAAAPQVGVYLNDLTGAKMSYYLRNEVRVRATSCADGVQTFTGRATVTSEAPPDVADQPDYVTGGGLLGTAVGTQSVFVRLHGPVGGTVSDVRMAGEKLVVDRADQDGRIVVTTVAFLAPGQSLDVTWTMTSGGGQTGDAEVSVTPGVLPGDSSSTVGSAC